MVSKAPGSFEEIWPEAFGRLKYQSSYASAFTAQLGLHRISRATWYLLTLQRPSRGSPAPNPFAGANCLFGGPQGPGFGLDGWCDLALVKTNGGGNANVVIPTQPSVTLAAGTYVDLTVAVKNVGCNQDCSAPDPNLLAAGGNGELYESETLAFVIK